jgi:hypothetical protein
VDSGRGRAAEKGSERLEKGNEGALNLFISHDPPTSSSRSTHIGRVLLNEYFLEFFQVDIG